jgi:hypothetical protein
MTDSESLYEEIKQEIEDAGRRVAEAKAKRQAEEASKPFLAREGWRNRIMYEGWMREDVIETVSDRAVITRSFHGYEVLNSADLGMVDVDFDLETDGIYIYAQEREALYNLNEWAAQHPGHSYRAYRTAGGLRVLRVDAPQLIDCSFDAWTATLGGDTLYAQLCHEQQAFRARLTPKPIRVGVQIPNWNVYSGFECSDPSGKLFPVAVKAYEVLAAYYKTCKLVADVGSGVVHPDLRYVVKVHDERTKVFSGLMLEPLAQKETYFPSLVDLLRFNKLYRPGGFAPDEIWNILGSDVQWALRILDNPEYRDFSVKQYKKLKALDQKWPVKHAA